MNEKEVRIINATQRGIARAKDELARDPNAWEPAVYAIIDPETRLNERLTSEICGYYAAMVQRWVEIGSPDVFT